jgi:hypothetical protein
MHSLTPCQEAKAQETGGLVSRVMGAMGRFLPQAQALEELQVATRLSAADCRALGTGLQANRSLLILSLTGSRCGDEGLRELAPGLASHTLNLLDVRDCGITTGAGESSAGQ